MAGTDQSTARPPARAPRAARAWRLDRPAARLRAWLHYQVRDHGALRHLWANAAEVAPGVWRSNHPTFRRLARMRDQLGLRTVLNLRGDGPDPRFLFEREACEALGLRLRSVALSARRPPRREELLALLDAFGEVERPVLLHCKSGADRTGFAAAAWLLVAGDDPAVARRQLSWRFLHRPWSRAGVLGRVLDLYARSPYAGQEGGFAAWAREAYDPAQLSALGPRR